MAGKTAKKGRLPPRLIKSLRWARYLVKTLEGSRFAGRRYHTEHVPPPIAKLNPFLLKCLQSKGNSAVDLVEGVGYRRTARKQAPSRSYVQLVSRPSMWSASVRGWRVKLIGEAAGWIYA